MVIIYFLLNFTDTPFPLSYYYPTLRLSHDIFSGSKDYGPLSGFHKLSKKIGGGGIFKTYAFGMPIISVVRQIKLVKIVCATFTKTNILTHILSFLYSQEWTK